MCGRYVQTKRARYYARLLAKLREAEARPETWNLAPTTCSMVVRQELKEITADWLSWGFLSMRVAARPINARVETAASKPVFRDAWKGRRCVVPADGWFEWREENRRKQPYFLRRKDGEPLFFAGLWADQTFAILTTAADGDLARIHDRRPLALGVDESRDWIERVPQSEGSLVAKAVPAHEIMFHRVGVQVSSPRNDGPELITEITAAASPAPPLELELFPNPD